MKEQRMRSTNLKDVMESQGRKKRWLAEAVGLSESYIGRVINGTRTISEPDANMIAEALDIPLFSLFEFTDVPNNSTVDKEAA